MSDLDQIWGDLVVANRILAREGVVDAYGHVSVRHPGRADRFFLSCSRSPELVTGDDIMEFGLDGEPVDPAGRSPYLERFIHAAIFEARPDVQAVVHNHSHDIVPFAVTKMPLRPLLHAAAGMGEHIPVWDIRERFGDTDLLVRDIEQGRDLARALGAKRMVLMRGHGCSVAGGSLRETVLTAIYAQVNARLQMQALQMGEITFLSPGEIRRAAETAISPAPLTRAWEYLSRRAGV